MINEKKRCLLIIEYFFFYCISSQNAHINPTDTTLDKTDKIPP